MKKFLTLVLALVLALGLSVPAMAFTSDDSDDVDHPYDLSIYLVEYDDNDLFGMVALPESDRGYAKNEIVAAVVELFVPKNETIVTAEYSKLVFGGDNVNLDVADNYDSSHHIDLECTSNVASKATVALQNALNGDDEIQINITSMPGKETYKWLFFAKVTDDDASLYAKLIDGTGSVGFANVAWEVQDPDEAEGVMMPNPAIPASVSAAFDNTKTLKLLTVTLGGDPYSIYFGVDDNDADNYLYLIIGDDLIYIYTNDDYKSTGMAIDPEGATGTGFFNLGVNTDG